MFKYQNNDHIVYGDIMFETIMLSILSLVVLFLLTKLMGYRQMTQLSMYDYIIGITIGSIASEMVVLSDFKDMIRPLTGMIIYTLFTLLLSYLSRLTPSFRHIIDGNPIVLYENDCINEQGLKKAKIDINEFLMQLRIQGYFDLTQLDQVILETNGNLSIFVKTKYRPFILSDYKSHIEEEKPAYTLLIDGHVFLDQLHYLHKDEKWFQSTLSVMGYHDYKDLLLVIYQQEKLTVYKKTRSSNE